MSDPSLTTRLLHLGLAAGVVLQLLLSTFMERLRPGADRGVVEALGFTVHELVGGLLLPLLMGWLAWAALRRGEPTLAAQFPWLRVAGRRAVLQALRLGLAAAAQRRIVPGAEVEPLVRSVHGLGVLCALFMAASGALVWWGMAPDGTLPGWAVLALDLHQGAASLMWAYLAGHGGMALLHQWQGERLLGRMFSLRSRRTEGQRS